MFLICYLSEISPERSYYRPVSPAQYAGKKNIELMDEFIKNQEEETDTEEEGTDETSA